jgi:hypothetical protein
MHSTNSRLVKRKISAFEAGIVSRGMAFPNPSALSYSSYSKSVTAAARCGLSVHSCLSCGFEFESSSIAPCRACGSNVVYSIDSFLSDNQPKPFEVSNAVTDFSVGLYNRVAAYQLPVVTAKDRALLSTNWRKPVFDVVSKHGEFAPSLFNSFVSICENKNYFEALEAVESASKRLRSHNLSVTMSESDIKELAKVKSQNLSKLLASISDEQKRFELSVTFLADLGLSFEPEQVKRANVKGELSSLVNRAADEHWLRRQFKRRFLRIVENVARDLNLVHKRKQAYCSDFTLNRFRQRQSDNLEALQNTIAVDEDDSSNAFSLSELSDKSVSNPVIRRAEMFVRLKGFEQVANELGHSAVFTTVTAPSSFHAVSGGRSNPKYIAANRPDPTKAHDHLMGVWSHFRKSMDKLKIKFYGMRIVEPHHDATPHHHMLIFSLPEHTQIIVSELRRLALLVDGDEKGAEKYRFDVEFIDKNKGSAIGYVAKYISKSVDGANIDKDVTTDLSGSVAAEKIVTWSRVNAIRQFQFFGGPSVTVWREMRRLREEIKEGDAMFVGLDAGQHYLLEKVRVAADEGDWGAFCLAMGGIFVKRADQTVKAHYSVPAAIEKLFESSGFAKTRFGDAAHARVNGIMFEGVFRATRFKNWKLVNKEEYVRARKQIMDGVVDVFDVLEREREYERMAEKNFQEWESMVQEYEELQALMFSVDDFSPVGEAHALVMNH